MKKMKKKIAAMAMASTMILSLKNDMSLQKAYKIKLSI